MKLKIVADRGTLLSKEIRQVEFPGKEGKFMVKANHAHLVSILDKGEIVYVDSVGKEGRIEILSGFVEVKKESVEVLAEVIGIK